MPKQVEKMVKAMKKKGMAEDKAYAMATAMHNKKKKKKAKKGKK